MEQNRIIINDIIASILANQKQEHKAELSALRRIASWAAPCVDYAYQDTESGKTISILFHKEYDELCEIKANAIKALNAFDAVMVCFLSRYMDLSNMLIVALEEGGLDSLPIGVMVYDYSGATVTLRNFAYPSTVAKNRTLKEQKSYWCWWRDSSHFEVATLLRLSQKYSNEEGDIYTNKVYPEFFDLMISGETKKWDGSPREKTFSQSSFKAEKQNYKIPMCQLGLWEVDTGHITEKGLTLLSIADKYGDDSCEYFNSLAKLILIDGKHLDLVKDLDDFQKKNPEIIPETSSDFFVLFDDFMMQKNSIGTRKPSAVKTGAKKAYVRDEPKLWNKLGIIKMQSSSRYFRPYQGIVFDWERINEIILSSADGGYHE